MLTIKAEIKRQEQKADGTYNVKLRFTGCKNYQTAVNALKAFLKKDDVLFSGSVRKAGCNPCYNRVKTLSLPHEAMASITNRIP